MKKIWLILTVGLLLTGCSKQKAMETVTDVYMSPEQANKQQIMLQLPQELSSPVLQNEEAGALYLCDEYSVTVQTVPAGDLAETVHNVTGVEKENLQMLHTREGDTLRYQWVWAVNGENGIQVGRGCILDDGSYHYVLTALADEDSAWKMNKTWQEMFASFHLAEGEYISTGS